MLTKTTTLLAKNSNGRLSYIFGWFILVHFFSFRTNFSIQHSLLLPSPNPSFKWIITNDVN